MRTRLPVLLGLALVAWSCGATRVATTTTAPTTTATAAAGTTTTSPPAPASSSSSTTLAPPTSLFIPTITQLPDGRAVLVAHDDGIDLVTADGAVPVLRGRAVAVAFPDRRGGVIFQEQPGDGGAVPIEWMRDLQAAPTVLIEPGEALSLWAVQTFEPEGKPALLYRRWVVLPNACRPDDVECVWGYHAEYLVVRDLQSGREQSLGMVGSFESDAVGIRLGGRWAAVAVNGYGGEDSCAGFVDLDRVEVGGEDWLPVHLGDFCVYGPTPTCPDGLRCTGESRAALSADGSRFAYAYSTGQVDDLSGALRLGPLMLAMGYPDGGHESAAVEIGPPGLDPTWMDMDGQYVLVGRTDRASGVDAAPVLAGFDGTVATVAIEGVARFWVPGVAEQPCEESVVLAPDGLGGWVFGTGEDEVAGGLARLLGPPTSDEIRTAADLPPGVDMFAATGYPAYAYLRTTTWAGAGLTVMFSDGLSAGSTGLEPAYAGPAFLGWIAGDMGGAARLCTAAGIGVGSPIEDLEAAFGSDLNLPTVADELTGGWHWSVQTPIESPLPEGGPLYLYGRLTGHPDGLDARVVAMSGGYGFDTC